MSTKELAINTIRGLPDTATWEDIEDRIRFLAAIAKDNPRSRSPIWKSHHRSN